MLHFIQSLRKSVFRPWSPRKATAITWIRASKHHTVITDFIIADFLMLTETAHVMIPLQIYENLTTLMIYLYTLYKNFLKLSSFFENFEFF